MPRRSHFGPFIRSSPDLGEKLSENFANSLCGVFKGIGSIGECTGILLLCCCLWASTVIGRSAFPISFGKASFPPRVRFCDEGFRRTGAVSPVFLANLIEKRIGKLHVPQGGGSPFKAEEVRKINFVSGVLSAKAPGEARTSNVKSRYCARAPVRPSVPTRSSYFVLLRFDRACAAKI